MGVGISLLIVSLVLGWMWKRSYLLGDEFCAWMLCVASQDGAMSLRSDVDGNEPTWHTYAVKHGMTIRDDSLHYSLVVLPLAVVSACILWRPIREKLAKRRDHPESA